jgi:hypothetical protein
VGIGYLGESYRPEIRIDADLSCGQIPNTRERLILSALTGVYVFVWTRNARINSERAHSLLPTEEHAGLARRTALTAEMADMERRAIYYARHWDCFAWLKNRPRLTRNCRYSSLIFLQLPHHVF